MVSHSWEPFPSFVEPRIFYEQTRWALALEKKNKSKGIYTITPQKMYSTIGSCFRSKASPHFRKKRFHKKNLCPKLHIPIHIIASRLASQTKLVVKTKIAKNGTAFIS